MLQYPINVYPDHTAFDSYSRIGADYFRGIKFTFKGDVLSSVFWRVYDYTTGNVVLEDKVYGDKLFPLCYNDGEVEIPDVLWQNSQDTQNRFPYGRYILQMMLTETRTAQNGATGYIRVNSHDRYVSRGKITSAYSTNDTTSIMLENEINVIYPWNKNGTVYSASVINDTDFTIRAAEIVMHIGNEVVPIVSYDSSTGEVTLANALLYDYPLGTPYQLYANYLITDLYYFETAKQPHLMATEVEGGTEERWIDWGAYGGTFKAIYWQTDDYYTTQAGTAIKYFTYDLLKVDEEGNEWEIFKSDKIYSQDVRFDFVDDYDDMALSGYHYKGEVDVYDDLPEDAEINDVYLNLWNEKYYVMTETGWEELDECGGNYLSRNYKIKLHFELQNGMFGDSVKSFVSPERLPSDTVPNRCETELDNDNNWVVINIRGGHVTGTMRFRIYRVYESADMYYVNPHKELIADISALSFTDYIVGNHGKYRYMVVPYDRISGNIYSPIVTDTITNDFYGYTITALKDTSRVVYGKPLYVVGDNWKIMADIDDTDNAQNINRVTHVGNGKYATVTASENNYVSGSLTAELGRMNCVDKIFNNDAAVMAEWREFISQDCPFILRNQKGDVWLVRITDGGSIKYGEEGRQINSVVTFSWVECGSIYDYLIQGEDINDRTQGG